MSDEHAIDFLSQKFEELDKPRQGDADDSSSISRLPDEIILQILNKLIDLKTLCFCYHVSKRFSAIVLEVDAISFTAPPLNPHIPDKNTAGDVHASTPVSPAISSFYDESFGPVCRFLIKFKGVKSLCLELPSFSEEVIDNSCLFKWKVKFGTKIESFIFLSPNSISDKDELYLNGNGDEEENNDAISDMFTQILDSALECLKVVVFWRILLLQLVKNLLKKVSITDSGRRGRLSLSAEKLSKVKEWVQSASETELGRLEIPDIVSYDYIPVLKLPVSGYVMKGIHFCVMEMRDLQGGNEGFMNNEDGFENKEEALYNEAVVEILEKHKWKMQMVRVL